MYVSVCVCVCVCEAYTCIFICICVYTYISMCIICMYMYANMYVRLYIHACIHTCLLTYLLTYSLNYLLRHIHAHIHTYIHTHIHTYRLTYLHACMHLRTYILTHIQCIHACIHWVHTHTCADQWFGPYVYMHQHRHTTKARQLLACTQLQSETMQGLVHRRGITKQVPQSRNFEVCHHAIDLKPRIDLPALASPGLEPRHRQQKEKLWQISQLREIRAILRCHFGALST